MQLNRDLFEWETLDVEKHDVESFLFDSKEYVFEHYLKHQANRDQAYGVNRTRVLTHEGTIIGFYTSRCSKIKVDPGEAQEVNKQGDILTVPALEIPYLGVDVRYRRHKEKIGEIILNEIMAYAYELSQEVGCRYVFLRAIHEPWLIEWYWRNGFDKTQFEGEDGWTVPMRYLIPQTVVYLEEDFEAEAGI